MGGVGIITLRDGDFPKNNIRIANPDPSVKHGALRSCAKRETALLER